MAKTEEKFEEFEDLQVSRNSLTILITGILVIVAGFVTYNFFADRAAQTADQDFPIEQLEEDLKNVAEENIINKEVNTVEGEEVQLEGGIAGSSTIKDAEYGFGGPEAGIEVASWIPTDIEPNSLKGEKIMVKEGDTLWELAEGRYGSGFEWTKILEANQDLVEFLPDGTQALIQPGQMLVLPN